MREKWIRGLGAAALALAAAATGGCGGIRDGAPAGDGAETDVGMPAVRSASPTPGLTGHASGDTVPGRWIVSLKQGAAIEEVTQAHGMKLDVAYRKALTGFAGPASEAQLRALKADPRVAAIEPDRVVTLAGRPEAQKRPGPPKGTTEALPTGIDRIDADLNTRLDVSGVGVAIIDTGIWLQHEDLRVVGSATFVSGTKSANDDNGHGTHVAGTVGAIAGNGVGVRGVAPGASLYAVKVLDRSGSGYLSWVIAGVNWVTEHAGQVKVANMSLGFQGSSSILDTAIHNSVSAGITYVVAAGNSAMDAAFFSPANHPDVIAVSAIADSDGRCGGLGPATGYGNDDTFALFSNYGACVDLAAPGVSIRSCWIGDRKTPGGRYATASGTSMASPHVAGAAALYLAGGGSPANALSALVAAGVPQGTFATPATDGGPDDTLYDGGFGCFTGDPDGGNPPERLAYTKSL